jgi:flagellar biosynthesis/type III secretory pathway M-ring protein FliF/YscJ
MNMKWLAKTVVSLLVLLGLTVPSFSQVIEKTPGDQKAEMGKAKKDSMKGKMKEHMEKKANLHEMKGKMKVHKDAAKAKGEDARGPVRAVRAPKSATAHPAAP